MARDILKDPPLYTTRFTATARVYTPSTAEQNEAHASIDRLKSLLPPDIDPEQHPTLLYVVGNLFVGQTLNRNDDAVTLEDTLRMYRAFEGQQINIEHSRASVVGYIVRAGLAEFGTDRLITEDEAREAGQPVNVAIAVGLWRVVDKDLIQYILTAAAPGAPTKDDLSLSFEVGFDTYSVVVMPKGAINLGLAKRVIPESDRDFKAWDLKLRANKGSGQTRDGDRVGRILNWPIIPMGGGIVAEPAGAVKGITPILPEGFYDMDEAEAGMYSFSSTQCTLSAEDAAPFLEYAAQIPDAYLYESAEPEKEGRYGREHTPHITVRYGLKGNDSAPVIEALKGCGPIKGTLGKVSAFVNDDKPYDVLKVEVVSEDLHRINALIGAAVEHEDTHPSYNPHLTLAYVRKGLAAEYVGDTRFEGRAFAFPSVTFSPAEGQLAEIYLDQPTVPPSSPSGPVSQTGAAQSDPHLVYSPSEPTDLGSASASMSQPSRTLKLSEGWQAKLAELVAAAGEAGFPHGIDVGLSDGRTIKGMKVLEAAMMGSDIEYTYDGVVITSMTPGVPNPEYMPPGKEDIYPTTDAKARAEAQAEEARKKVAQNNGYTGASVIASLVQKTVAASLLQYITSHDGVVTLTSASVSSPTPSIQPMKLEDLKQSVANVKSVEDLPTVMANVSAFVDIIAKASEEQVAARKTAEQEAAANKASLTSVETKLADLTASYNALITAQQSAAAEQALQTRMAAVEEVFAFDDEARADVMPEIKACVDDAAFTTWMTRAKRMYKGFLKSAATAGDKGKPFGKKDDEEDMDDGGECAASAKAAQEALASAKANVTDKPVSNMVDAAQPGETMEQTYARVFSKSVRIAGQTVESLNEASAKAKKTI